VIAHRRPLVALSLCSAVASLTAVAAPAADHFVSPNGGGTACLQSSPCSLVTALGAAGDGDRMLGNVAATTPAAGTQVIAYGGGLMRPTSCRAGTRW